MTTIEYSENEYTIIQTLELDDELLLKLVQFNTGHYGIITQNRKTNNEIVTLISPEKGTTKNKNEVTILTGGLGCLSYMQFARDAKHYHENTPIELVVKLGENTSEEYREIITQDQAKTLYERAEICYEILSMKLEDSFHYKYGDKIMTIFMCLFILFFVIAIVNTIRLHGGII